jgi:hypothetical protein
MYERMLEMIENAETCNMYHTDFLERISLMMAEEIDEMKEELETLKEKYESEHE